MFKTSHFFSDAFFKITGELWGDRAIFIRSEILKDRARIMDVPIMEDVKLSGFMEKKGKRCYAQRKSNNKRRYIYKILFTSAYLVEMACICGNWFVT
jgi:hypothetical protein